MAENNNFMGSTLAVAVTAGLFSPLVRKVLHGGAVQGLAGVLIASDAVSSFARGVARGLQAEQPGAQPSVPASDAPEAHGAARGAAAAPDAAAPAQNVTASPEASSRARKSAAKPKPSGKPEGGAS